MPCHDPGPHNGYSSRNRRSRPSSARFANTGEMIPPRLQPFAKNSPVHGDVSHQPLMADVVETASYIAFQHPARMSCEGLEAAFDRIRAGTPLAKPIGVFIRLRLCHGIECKQ